MTEYRAKRPISIDELSREIQKDSCKVAKDALDHFIRNLMRCYSDWRFDSYQNLEDEFSLETILNLAITASPKAISWLEEKGFIKKEEEKREISKILLEEYEDQYRLITRGNKKDSEARFYYTIISIPKDGSPWHRWTSIGEETNLPLVPGKMVALDV